MNSQPRQNLTRPEWFARLFPKGVPQLWCPPLTHYDAGGAIDSNRIRAHLKFISAWVKGLLVPGSTGDAWELTDSETEQLLDSVLQAVKPLDQKVLIGALRPESAEACRIIAAATARLPSRRLDEAVDAWLLRNSICGVAVCPPRGEALTQVELDTEISSILQLHFPTALYQLPQVTRNEMSPELVADLAARFPNFILFKDTSGNDTVAKSGQDLKGVFLVRGMEGEYARWLKPAGGPYNGFLLSAANCFARELSEIIQRLKDRQLSLAQNLSTRVSHVMTEVFSLVKNVPSGNVFANGGKAIDHFFAFGPRALQASPPRLHSGTCLPLDLIRATGETLNRWGLMPSSGYLD